MKKRKVSVKSIGIFLRKIWNDPVISSVIASAIVLLSPSIWALVKRHSISLLYKNLLMVKIPLYCVILAILGIFLMKRLIMPLLTVKKDSIWDEQIGNYKFKELYTILKRQTLPVQTTGMQWANRQAPTDDLLHQFCTNKIFLNKGVTMDSPLEDGGYIWSVFCPKMMDYGLVSKTDYIDERTKYSMIKYQITEDGNKFYSLVEKIMLYDVEHTQNEKKSGMSIENDGTIMGQISQ